MIGPNQAPGHEADPRYSLVELMAEISLDRKHSAMSRELLSRVEIDKIFKSKRRLMIRQRANPDSQDPA